MASARPGVELFAPAAGATLKSHSRYNFLMARTAREILEDARQLPSDELDWLVESLLIKADGEPQAEMDAAWDAEIKRRLGEIDSGAVKLVPLEDVLTRLDERAARRGE
jgi:hypothetical protein